MYYTCFLMLILYEEGFFAMTMYCNLGKMWTVTFHTFYHICYAKLQTIFFSKWGNHTHTIASTLLNSHSHLYKRGHQDSCGDSSTMHILPWTRPHFDTMYCLWPHFILLSVHCQYGPRITPYTHSSHLQHFSVEFLHIESLYSFHEFHYYGEMI